MANRSSSSGPDESWRAFRYIAWACGHPTCNAITLWSLRRRRRRAPPATSVSLRWLSTIRSLHNSKTSRHRRRTPALWSRTWLRPSTLNAVPLAAVAHQLQAVAGREEPPCLRRHLLVALNLQADLPVHFIDEKIVKSSDLKAQQNRFRIPNSGVPNLCKILTPEDLDSANLIHVGASMSKLPSQQPEQDNGAAEEEQAGQEKMKSRVYDGLRVKLVDLIAGAKELQLSRWGSSDGTIIKGKGYLDFIRQCSFKKNDVVEIWAFKQHSFHHFGKTMCDESLLHVLIIKKDQQPQCAYCPLPG